MSTTTSNIQYVKPNLLDAPQLEASASFGDAFRDEVVYSLDLLVRCPAMEQLASNPTCGVHAVMLAAPGIAGR